MEWTFNLLSLVIFFLLQAIVPVGICSVVANWYQMPKKWCLLGLFGVPGIIIIFIVGSIREKRRFWTNEQDIDYQSNYENNTEYHTTGTHWHNVAEHAGKKHDSVSDNMARWQPADDCRKKEDVVYVNGERVEREFIVCKNCGGKMQKGTNFCTYCGQDL